MVETVALIGFGEAGPAFAAARQAASAIGTNALFFDMHSVAPDMKRAAARAIGALGYGWSPTGLEAKLAALAYASKGEAA